MGAAGRSRVLRCPALRARDDVGRIPVGPVVFRRGGLELAVAVLGVLQQIRQGRDVQAAEAAAGKPRLDFLEQPAVAVGITERGVGAVGAAIGMGPWQRRAADAGEMEQVADVYSAGDELCAASRQIGERKVQVVDRPEARPT